MGRLDGYVPSPLPEDGKVVCQHREEEGLTPCTAARFRELTGMQFVEELHMTQEALAGFWKKGPEQFPSVFGEIERDGPWSQVSFGKASEEAPEGFGVFAEEAIPFGKPIVPYLGELNAEETGESYLNPIQGDRFSNLGPLCNSGFPNAISDTMNWKGIRICYLSSLGIEAGEPVVIDYGVSHFCRFNRPYVEVRYEALKQFVTENDLSRIYSKILASGQTGENLVSFAHLKYVLETPAVWLRLIADEVFPDQQLTSIYSQINNIPGWNQDRMESRIQFVVDCVALKRLLTKLKSPQKERFLEALGAWSQQFSLAGLAIGLQLLSKLLQHDFVEGQPDFVDGIIQVAESVFAFCEALAKISTTPPRGARDIDAAFQSLKSAWQAMESSEPVNNMVPFLVQTQIEQILAHSLRHMGSSHPNTTRLEEAKREYFSGKGATESAMMIQMMAEMFRDPAGKENFARAFGAGRPS